MGGGGGSYHSGPILDEEVPEIDNGDGRLTVWGKLNIIS